MGVLCRIAVILLAAMFAGDVPAETRTVCTITVNSADEKEAFRQRLPQADYRFVELVEKGNRDWLRASCGKAIRCDVLVVSGHFNAGDVFYSDRLTGDDYLRIDELERASCSNSCPALFAQLKEVYLFGCESLNPDAARYSSSQGDGGRDRMRRIFAGVPVIYGFSSAAPVGATAATLLNRYFDSAAGEVGSGRVSSRLLAAFARNHMTSTRGVGESGSDADHRAQVCRFFDERITAARKLSAIHATMRRDMGLALASFERIEALPASLTDGERLSADYLQALAEISADDATRARFLAAARATRQPALRSRMIALAQILGWLSPQERRQELVAMIDDVLATPPGFAEVGLVCALNDAGDLTSERGRVKIPAARAGQLATSAIMACLGDAPARVRILAAIASSNDRDVQVAQAYMRLRPVADARELRAIAREISRMPASGAQIRALDTLGRLRLEDRETMEGLALWFAAATSITVQRAIAEVFLRSEPKAMARLDLSGMLRRERIRSPDGDDLIEVLIRRLQLPTVPAMVRQRTDAPAAAV